MIINYNYNCNCNQKIIIIIFLKNNANYFNYNHNFVCRQKYFKIRVLWCRRPPKLLKIWKLKTSVPAWLVIVIKIKITPTRSWPTPTQEKEGPTPTKRANPHSEKGQPLPKRGKGQPNPDEGRANSNPNGRPQTPRASPCLIFFYPRR